MAKPIPTADQMADSWSAGLQSPQAADKMKRSIAAVQQYPGVAAAAASGTWQQNVSSARARSKFEQNVADGNLGEWQQAMITDGIQHMGDAARRKKGKARKAFAKVAAMLATVTPGVRSMPKGTFAERRARALAQMDGMHQAAGGG